MVEVVVSKNFCFTRRIYRFMISVLWGMISDKVDGKSMRGAISIDQGDSLEGGKYI